MTVVCGQVPWPKDRTEMFLDQYHSICKIYALFLKFSVKLPMLCEPIMSPAMAYKVPLQSWPSGKVTPFSSRSLKSFIREPNTRSCPKAYSLFFLTKQHKLHLINTQSVVWQNICKSQIHGQHFVLFFSLTLEGLPLQTNPDTGLC